MGIRSGLAIRGVPRPAEALPPSVSRRSDQSRQPRRTSLIPSLLLREPTGITGEERLHPGQGLAGWEQEPPTAPQHTSTPLPILPFFPVKTQA